MHAIKISTEFYYHIYESHILINVDDMEGNKRRKSGENSPKSKKKQNKLKRHAPKHELKSKETVTSTDDESSDGSQSDADVDVNERHSEEPLPLPESPIHSTPSTPGSESQSRSQSPESIDSIRLDSDGEEVENDPVGGPPTPGGNSNAVALVDPTGPSDELDLDINIDVPINAPPSIQGLEHRQMDIAERRELHVKEGTNAPNFLQIIIFTR